jgi:hypothetical protein
MLLTSIAASINLGKKLAMQRKCHVTDSYSVCGQL